MKPKPTEKGTSRPIPGNWQQMNRKQRREMTRKIQSGDIRLEVVHADAAGIDIGNETHYVAVPPTRDSQPVRRFGCTTAELKEMAVWLKQCAIRTVAMQSTGVYWIAVYDILEQAGLEVYLVNARDTKNLPGRKSDVQESQWLMKLHTYGLLRNSFRPGRLVRIDEVENGIVSGYQVFAGNPADTTAWMPALQQHQACFGRAPKMATGDRGFFSATNEQEAHALGVKKVALPARGRLSATRSQQQKQRWFRRALRWRAGCEATISTLKHPFSMGRATYKGELGFQRYVGWCVITKNLFSIARDQERRRSHGQVG